MRTLSWYFPKLSDKIKPPQYETCKGQWKCWTIYFRIVQQVSSPQHPPAARNTGFSGCCTVGTKNKCANLRRCLGCLTLQTHLISWMREILRGDMAGLVSDFRLSESRSIPRFRRKQFLVSRNPSQDSKINIKIR